MIAAILRIIAADTIDPYASFNASFISAYQRQCYPSSMFRLAQKQSA